MSSTNEDFTQLRSDIKLRECLAKLDCENPGDKRTLEIVAQQSSFSGPQRLWLNALLSRKGKKFVFKEPKTK